MSWLGKPVESIVLDDQDRNLLQRLAASQCGQSPEARRAAIILLSADGHSSAEICRILSCSGQTVTAWRRRFQKWGIAGLSRSLLLSSRTTQAIPVARTR